MSFLFISAFISLSFCVSGYRLVTVLSVHPLQTHSSSRTAALADCSLRVCAALREGLSTHMHAHMTATQPGNSLDMASSRTLVVDSASVRWTRRSRTLVVDSSQTTCNRQGTTEERKKACKRRGAARNKTTHKDVIVGQLSL